jgi:lysophospholipase L1-like esterase
MGSKRATVDGARMTPVAGAADPRLRPGSIAPAPSAGLREKVGRVRRWCERHPARCLVLAAVLTILGAAVIALSVRDSSALVGGVGVLVAVGGLHMLDDCVGCQSDRHPTRWLLMGVVATAAGLAVLAGAFAVRSPSIAAVGVLIVVVALLPVGQWLQGIAEKEGRAWQAVVGPAVIVIGIILGSLLGRVLVSLVIAAVGLIGYKVGVRRACAKAGAVTWTVVGLVAALAGAGLAVLATATRDVHLGGYAVIAGVLGLTALSAGWPGLKLRRLARPLIAFGVLLLLAGTLQTMTLHLSVWATLAFAVVAALAGASFVWHGESFVAVILIGSALVWLAVGRVDRAPADPNPQASQRILALGDSYISGEGSPSYLPGTNSKGRRTNECRRSRTAFPYLLAQHLGMGLDFYACSGAKADDIWASGQEPQSGGDVPGALPQLANLGADRSKISLVLVTIGGNDANFAEIGKACVLPGSCDSLEDLWLAGLDQIGPQIGRAYGAIRKELPGVPVVVVPYPLMLEDHGCRSSTLDDREHKFLSQFVVTLDDRVRVAAAQAGVWFFDGGMFALDTGKICGPRGSVRAMNQIALNPVEGSLWERLNPNNWIHNSLHPKPAGHQLMEQALNPWVKQLLAAVRSATVGANPEPNPDAVFEFRNDPSTVRQLVAEKDRPTSLPCEGVALGPFATEVRLFDAVLGFPIDAERDADLCVTDTNGVWKRVTPDGPDAAATESNGVVYVRPAPPLRGSGKQEVVYMDTDRRWQLRLVDFCTKATHCPKTVEQFENTELAETARAVMPPTLVLVLAGWMIAIGWTTLGERGQGPRGGPVRVRGR